jgi:hypothetical protein
MLLHMCRIQVPVFALAPHGKLVLAGRERSEIKRCLQRRTPVTKRRQAGCRRSRPSVGIDHPDFVRARTETGREPDGDVQTAARQRKRLTQAFRLPPARAVFSQIDIDAERLRRQLSPCNLFDWLDCTGVLVWWCGILESEGREPEEASYDDDSRRDCSPFQPLGKLISHTVSRCRSRAEIPVDPAATVPATAATASWPRVRVTHQQLGCRSGEGYALACDRRARDGVLGAPLERPPRAPLSRSPLREEAPRGYRPDRRRRGRS